MKNTIIWCWLLSTGVVSADTAFSEGAVVKEPGRADTDVKHAHDRVAEINADAVALRAVLQEIAGKIPLEVKFAEPALAGCMINRKVEAITLKDALAKLLDGFSYILYPTAGGTLALTVLSPCPSSALAQARERDSPPATPKTETIADGTPLTLEDLEPLASPSTQADAAGDSPTRNSKDAQEAERSYQEAVVKRALDAINSPYQHLKSEAVKSLAESDEPEASLTLIAAATGTLDLPLEARAEAVAALARDPTNAAAIRALEQLVQDPDAGISNAARKVLGNRMTLAD